LTAPLRARGRQTGDADIVNLWAGQTHELAQELPAAELVGKLHREALDALSASRTRLDRC
jgi:nitronate monooxygenase